MLSALAFVIVLSPFPFEINSGLSLEPNVGVFANDRTDDSALAGGLRISAIVTNATDALVTFEIAGGSRHLFTGEGERPQTFWQGTAALAVYEFFNPAALRFLAGGGVERR